jgi:SAM-dependent methyltransferase
VIYTKRLLTGLLSYVPGATRIVPRGTGGTESARYCYAVWLRHLVRAHAAGMTAPPDSVAELGPGDSLGTGLAALLSGARSYYAFDVVRYASDEANRAILEELISLFASRLPIPRPEEFPELHPLLKSYEFPDYLFPDERLERSLAPRRLDAIRTLLGGARRSGELALEYVPDWYDSATVPEGSLDLVFSQAVLEHVDELEEAYAAMRRWLKPGGVASHTIDYRSHGTARGWNGHWALGELSWRLVRGRRPFLLNREPHSTHTELLRRYGFEVVTEIAARRPSDVRRDRLAARFRGLSEDDLTTSLAFIQAVKPR